MTKPEIIAECRANPDKIFYILKRDDFAKAIKLFGYCLEGRGICTISGRDVELVASFDAISCKCHEYPTLDLFEYHLEQLALAPDEMAYLEEHGKEGE